MKILLLFLLLMSAPFALADEAQKEFQVSGILGEQTRLGRWTPLAIDVPAKFSEARAVEIRTGERQIFRYKISGPGQLRASFISAPTVPEVLLLDANGKTLATQKLDAFKSLKINERLCLIVGNENASVKAFLERLEFAEFKPLWKEMRNSDMPENLRDFSAVDLLVLCRSQGLTDRQLSTLAQWTNSGGNLVITAKEDLAKLREVIPPEDFGAHDGAWDSSAKRMEQSGRGQIILAGENGKPLAVTFSTGLGHLTAFFGCPAFSDSDAESVRLADGWKRAVSSTCAQNFNRFTGWLSADSMIDEKAATRLSKIPDNRAWRHQLLKPATAVFIVFFILWLWALKRKWKPLRVLVFTLGFALATSALVWWLVAPPKSLVRGASFAESLHGFCRAEIFHSAKTFSGTVNSLPASDALLLPLAESDSSRMALDFILSAHEGKFTLESQQPRILALENKTLKTQATKNVPSNPFAVSLSDCFLSDGSKAKSFPAPIMPQEEFTLSQPDSSLTEIYSRLENGPRSDRANFLRYWLEDRRGLFPEYQLFVFAFVENPADIGVASGELLVVFPVQASQVTK